MTNPVKNPRAARSVTNPETTLEDSREFRAGEREGERMAKIAKQRGLNHDDAWHLTTHEQNFPKFVADAAETDDAGEDDPRIAYGMGLGHGFGYVYRD